LLLLLLWMPRCGTVSLGENFEVTVVKAIGAALRSAHPSV